MYVGTSGPFPLILQSAMRLNPTATADALTMLTQSAQFMSMRMDMSLKAQQDLLACKTPEEVYQVQTDYLQTAIEHYTFAAKGMLDHWNHMLRDASQPPRPRP